MRRADKQILDHDLIGKVIEKAEVCRLGLSRDDLPYIVPVAFGYDGRYIYFHTAAEGLKIDIMTGNNRVCFEMEHDVRIVPGEAACKWSFSFLSVIGFGIVEEITDAAGKTHALRRIMMHYSPRTDWEFTLENLRLWRIEIEQMTGKQST